MKILLINPNLSAADRYGKSLGKVGPSCEPLGLAYIAAVIREKRSDEIKILDGIPFNLSLDDIKKEVEDYKPDVIGITFLTPMFVHVKKLIEAVKEVSEAKIVVGGPHLTIMPMDTLKDIPQVDFGVVGEGEETFPELCDAFEGKLELKDVKGIVYRDDGIKMTAMRNFVDNIDDCPLPARDLLPMESYVPAPTYYQRTPTFLVLTSRGCPFRCVYCSKIGGRKYRHHSIERVLKEVNVLIDEYKAKEIIFRDDTFTVNRKFAMDLCNVLIENGINKKIKWTCMTRVTLVDKEILSLMKKAGCWSIHFGIESGSQRLLKLIKKDIDLNQAKKAVKWCREVGIETKAFFMLGLPTETKEESEQTIRFTRDLDPDMIQVTLTVPYPGTELYNMAKEDGTLNSMNWEDYQTWAGWADKDLVFVPKGREAKELKEMQKRAMREFFLRPKVIFRLVTKIKSYDMFKMYFAGAYALVESKLKKS
ncbi:B12-binding domain-containing radical SAM protein [archaeon]|nr:B12-binding domain-containing radical SAM protein [archaeon]